MHITWIETQQLPPLGDILFDCDERVNLFIGPNASGKTTILRGIEYLYSLGQDPLEVEENRHVYDHKLNDGSRAFNLGASHDWTQDSSGSMATIWGTASFLYIPASRTSLPAQNIFYQTIDHAHEMDRDGDYYPYQVNSPNHESLENMFHAHFGNLPDSFDGVFLEDTIDWIRRTVAGNRSQQNQFRKALEVGYSCAKRICPEVMHDDAPHPFVELDEEREISDTGRVVHYSMGIGTSDDITGEPLYAGALSSGTQGTPLCLCPGSQNGIRLWLDGGLGRKAGHPAD